MQLHTERKIKVWLTLTTKVLVISWIAFKFISAFFFTDSVQPESEGTLPLVDTLVVSEGAHTKLTDSRESIRGNTVENTKDQTKKEKKRVTGLVEDGPKAPVPKSMGILIFNGNNPDTQIAGHLEKIFFREYSAKPILIDKISVSRLQLLSGNISHFKEVETVCIGTVSYKFTEDNSKISCTLSLNFDSYSTATGFKIQELSQSLVRYGIGFSKEQAKQVAMNKVNILQ